MPKILTIQTFLFVAFLLQLDPPSTRFVINTPTKRNGQLHSTLRPCPSSQSYKRSGIIGKHAKPLTSFVCSPLTHPKSASSSPHPDHLRHHVIPSGHLYQFQTGPLLFHKTRVVVSPCLLGLHTSRMIQRSLGLLRDGAKDGEHGRGIRIRLSFDEQGSGG